MHILDHAPAVEATTRTELARLVAHRYRPRPFTIDAENGYADRLDTLDAPEGVAWACTVAPDVLAIDCDNPAQLDTFDRYADAVRADGWPVMVVASGRPGHRHLFAVIPVRQAKRTWQIKAAEYELPAPRDVMRPPGSPHRLGLPVELLDDPAVFMADAEQLRAQTVRPTSPKAWRDLLRSGRWWPEYTGNGGGSEMVWSVCIGAYKEGLELAEVRRLLADPANVAGRAYRARLSKHAKKHADYWLEHYVWAKAVRAAGEKVITPANAAEAVAMLDALRDAVHAAQWPGIAGATDRALLLALIAQGRKHETLTPTVSHRGLAERAHITRPTVSRSAKRLAAAGWLQVARTGGPVTEKVNGEYHESGRATRWRLIPRKQTRDLLPRVVTPQGSTPLTGNSARVHAWRDISGWSGIGLNGSRVFELLVSLGAATPRELGEALGLNVGNLRSRLLPRLARCGLVVAPSVRGGCWGAPVDPVAAVEAAAVSLGLVGRAAEQMRQHDAERESYYGWREDERPEREATSAKRQAAARSVEREAREREELRRADEQLPLAVPPAAKLLRPDEPGGGEGRACLVGASSTEGVPL